LPGNAEVLRVQLYNKSGTTSRMVNVRYLPTHSWLQNLLLTPAYADNLISFTEQADKDFKVHVLSWAQRSCAAMQSKKVRKKCMKMT